MRSSVSWHPHRLMKYPSLCFWNLTAKVRKNTQNRSAPSRPGYMGEHLLPIPLHRNTHQLTEESPDTRSFYYSQVISTAGICENTTGAPCCLVSTLLAEISGQSTQSKRTSSSSTYNHALPITRVVIAYHTLKVNKKRKEKEKHFCFFALLERQAMYTAETKLNKCGGCWHVVPLIWCHNEAHESERHFSNLI